MCYSCLFDSGRGMTAAIIAANPLIFQASVFAFCLHLMMGDSLLKKRLLFHVVFWVAIINFMELFSYTAYKSFSLHGDIGNVNHGLGISPWPPFFVNVTLVLAGICLLFGRALPAVNVVAADGNPLTKELILVLSAFILFRLGSVLFAMVSIFLDQQWMLGLIGITSFVVIVFLCWPTKRWIIERELDVLKRLENVDLIQSQIQHIDSQVWHQQRIFPLGEKDRQKR